MKLVKFSILLGLVAVITACAPVGSDRWCKSMKETPKGEWSFEDTKAYSKNCILK